MAFVISVASVVFVMSVGIAVISFFYNGTGSGGGIMIFILHILTVADNNLVMTAFVFGVAGAVNIVTFPGVALINYYFVIIVNVVVAVA